MNDNISKYYDELFTHKNNLPRAPQSEHIRKREIIDKNHKYRITDNDIIFENTLPLINIERGTCPECDCKTYSYDSWRGEKVCPQCGLVLEENIPQIIPTRDVYKKPSTDFTWEEKMYLRKYGHHRYSTDTKQWYNNHDNRTIKSLSCQAQLNKKQQIETKYIIDNMGFKKLHSRANKPEIICAVIRYVMKQSGTIPPLLRFNQGVFKDFLTQDIYNIVEQNITNFFKGKEYTTP